MVTFLFISILLSVLSIIKIINYNTSRRWSNVLSIIFYSIVGVVISSIIGMLVALFVGVFCQKEYSVYDTFDIVAIKDGNQINGNFIIGSGTIDNVMYYNFYKKVNDNIVHDQNDTVYFINGKIKSDDAIIKYTEYQPRIDKLRRKFVNKKCDLWGMTRRGEKYVIYVPKWSIKYEYIFDLE